MPPPLVIPAFTKRSLSRHGRPAGSFFRVYGVRKCGTNQEAYGETQAILYPTSLGVVRTLHKIGGYTRPANAGAYLCRREEPEESEASEGKDEYWKPEARQTMFSFSTMRPEAS